MRFRRCGKRAQSDKYVPSSQCSSFTINFSGSRKRFDDIHSRACLFPDNLRFIKQDKQKLWQKLQMVSLRKSASSSQGIAFNKQTSRQHRGDSFNPFCSLAESFSQSMPLPSGGNQDKFERRDEETQKQT